MGMNYDAIAKRYDDMKERGEELNNLVPVKASTPRNADSIYSIRFTSKEMQELAEAARREGMKVSQFIRRAVFAAARGQASTSKSGGDHEEELALLRQVAGGVNQLLKASSRD
jgi:hypothetical protein